MFAVVVSWIHLKVFIAKRIGHDIDLQHLFQ